MRVAIMQPTYLPWCGYFDLVDQADIFVFLDTVDFARQRPNWQRENRILAASGTRWLRLPTQRSQEGGGLIKNIGFKHQEWRRQHLEFIMESYEETPFYSPIVALLEPALNTQHALLADLNIALIKTISDYLGIETQFVRASDLPNITATKDGRLLALCEAVEASSYLSPLGSAGYIDPVGFARRQVALSYQNFEHPVYDQAKNQTDFVAYMSTIDLLFNIGPQSLSILRSGRRPACQPDEIPQTAS